MQEKQTKLIIGLGNPGKDYDGTRHNIGFRIIDEFAFKNGLALKKEKKFEAEVCISEVQLQYLVKKKSIVDGQELIANDEEIKQSTIGNRLSTKTEESHSKIIKLIVIKPQTYMNNSGRAISKIVNFHKIPIEDILLIHDDVSLDTGRLKLAFNSGAGGQHGVEDTINAFGGSKKFHRIKVGVGPDPGGDTRSDYVLSPFPKKEKELVDTMVSEAQDIIKTWLTEEDPQQVTNPVIARSA